MDAGGETNSLPSSIFSRFVKRRDFEISHECLCKQHSILIYHRWKFCVFDAQNGSCHDANSMKVRSRQFRQVLIGLACLSTSLAFTSIFSKTVGTHFSRQVTVVRIFFKPGHPSSQFESSNALGAAIDGHEKGELDHMLSRANVSEMLSAGLKPISYRLRTELAGEAWHWNPKGSWTDGNSGYWISQDKPGSSELSLS